MTRLTDTASMACEAAHNVWRAVDGRDVRLRVMMLERCWHLPALQPFRPSAATMIRLFVLNELHIVGSESFHVVQISCGIRTLAFTPHRGKPVAKRIHVVVPVGTQGLTAIDLTETGCKLEVWHWLVQQERSGDDACL